MGLGIPPLQIKIMLESTPLKSTMLVGRLGVALERAGLVLGGTTCLTLLVKCGLVCFQFVFRRVKDHQTSLDCSPLLPSHGERATGSPRFKARVAEVFNSY